MVVVVVVVVGTKTTRVGSRMNRSLDSYLEKMGAQLNRRSGGRGEHNLRARKR